MLKRIHKITVQNNSSSGSMFVEADLYLKTSMANGRTFLVIYSTLMVRSSNLIMPPIKILFHILYTLYFSEFFHFIILKVFKLEKTGKNSEVNILLPIM